MLEGFSIILKFNPIKLKFTFVRLKELQQDLNLQLQEVI